MNLKIRPAAVAGQFYPSDAKELETLAGDYLSQTKLPEVPDKPRIVISPHAGYVYSGRVAAYAFKSLENSGYKRAVIIGRSHQEYFGGVAADENGEWETPLGNIKVDQDFVGKLAESSGIIKKDSSPHENEHSLEAMLPFLIKVLGNDFKIVPLLFGAENYGEAEKLAEALKNNMDSETVVIISSDFSHYPSYESANDLDKKTIEAILANSAVKFQDKMKEIENYSAGKADTLACGEIAILSAISLSEKLGLKPSLLKYANSGDYFPETKDRVVGYAAISFSAKIKADSETENELNKSEQEQAINIAKKTLESHFKGEEYYPGDLPEIFQEKRGVFVTLKKNEELRGCIGNFSSGKSLAENIKDMAEAAAFHDPRFSPLDKNELDGIEIEISVLSPMEKVANADGIEIGKHGVYVKKGIFSGVYLPQVATEQGWDKETFLNSLCASKAGLNEDCWKDGETEIYIFTAQVF